MQIILTEQEYNDLKSKATTLDREGILKAAHQLALDCYEAGGRLNPFATSLHPKDALSGYFSRFQAAAGLTSNKEGLTS